jgi:CRP-like cAMP-binding protein
MNEIPLEIDYETLSLSPLLVGLNTAELEALVTSADVRTFSSGQVIVEEGEPGESMFILHDGEVVIEKRTGGGDSVELTRLSRRGDFFGEMVFVDILPRSATVRAHPEARLIEFPLEALRRFFESHPDAHLSIVLNMTRVLSKRLRAANEQIAELKRQGPT